jgi:ketosteroid isomerase-like protein
LNLHSKDVVRSPRNAKQVWNWETYLQETIAADEQDIREKRKRQLELRFTERINNATQAVEVGIYKTTYQLANGETQIFYGRFHVVLRQEEGKWKILVDTDSSEKGTVGEKEFLEASPLD